MESNQNLLSTEIQVDSIAATHLKETAMWAKFLAVLGMVISVLLAVAGLFAGTWLTGMNRSFGGDASAAAMSAGIITILYIFIGAVYFVLSLYLFRFAVRMKQALLTTDQDSFNSSLLNLKLVYRILGIIMIIYLAFLALALVGGIGAAMMGA